jgi:hypothetical protein
MIMEDKSSTPLGRRFPAHLFDAESWRQIIAAPLNRRCKGRGRRRGCSSNVGCSNSRRAACR